MKINIAVEKGNVLFKFDKPTINFPFKFMFKDRLSEIWIEVSLDLNSFKILIEEISKKTDIGNLNIQKCNSKII